MQENLKEVRCPICNRMLGKFNGRGEVICPKCKIKTLVSFDTTQNKISHRAP